MFLGVCPAQLGPWLGPAGRSLARLSLTRRGLAQLDSAQLGPALPGQERNCVFAGEFCFGGRPGLAQLSPGQPSWLGLVWPGLATKRIRPQNRSEPAPRSTVGDRFKRKHTHIHTYIHVHIHTCMLIYNICIYIYIYSVLSLTPDPDPQVLVVGSETGTVHTAC